ncbi:ABC transporter substrate-binding protein [Herminiimonas arsenitoxidans]|uniref:ABC transporter substrate-binding protein n=1 Tax=Herminiimonas arsenitoxidans TaxID=1809410 RepID=UPI0009702B9C|nr:ABC transporter substrate-binding protein [Herminiimonas arsenitoxidans]
MKSTILTAVVAASAAAAFSGNAIAQNKPLKKITVLQPVSAPDVRFAPWAAAIENGWFAEEGLDPEVLTAKGSIAVVQQVVSGNVQYGLPAPESAAVGRAKGAPLVHFYSITTRNPFPLAVLKDGPIKKLSDLKGTQIGVFSMTATQFYTTQAILDAENYKLNRDYTLLDVGIGAGALRALETGTVSALSINALSYAGFENRGVKLNYLTSPVVEDILAWGLLTTESYLKANRAEAVGLARALTKGRIFCEQNTEACIRLYFKHYPAARTAGIPEAQAIAENQRVLKVFQDYSPKPSSGRWGEYTKQGWEGIVRYMTTTGQITTPVDPASLYTNNLIKDINNFDPTVAVNAAKKATR